MTNWPGGDEAEFDEEFEVQSLLPVRSFPPGPPEGPWLRLVLGIAAALVFVTRATMPFVLLMTERIEFDEAIDLVQRHPDTVDLIFVGVLAFYFGRNTTRRPRYQ